MLHTRQAQQQLYKDVFIQFGPFIFFIAADIGAIILCFIIWRFLWVRINRLEIRNVKEGINYRINTQSNYLRVFIYLRAIIRNMMHPNNFVMEKCGFEAYTFLYFQRRMAQILAVICISDLCVWIPYQLVYNPINQFNLITMPSKGNANFRTFYTIFIASFILFSLYSLYKYLRLQLLYRMYKDPSERVFNNLKTKTLHVNFLGQKFYNQAQVKSQIQQYLVQDMGIEDRILAIMPIPNYSQLLDIQYKLKIIEIVSEVGIQNTSCLWKLLKAKNFQQIEDLKQQTKRQLIHKIGQSNNQIESCFVIVSQMQTAEKLCKEFQISKALYKVCPDIFYTNQQVFWMAEDKKMIIKWAQQPRDIMWINMSLHKEQLFKFIVFNIVCIILLVCSFTVIVATAGSVIQFPKLLSPLILPIVNSTLRFSISKMVEFENKLCRSQQEIKQFRILCIYFFINVILGSLFQNIYNLLGYLQYSWGFIQVIQLIYERVDGYLYYLFIFNQTVIAFMDALVKPGDIGPDIYQSLLYYQKCTRVKQKSTYGKNDSFRYGFSYGIDFIVLSVVLIYSVSNPLIHLFGMVFFFFRYHLNCYTLTVFHSQQVGSNLRLIIRVIQSITIMTTLWIFLIATSLIFDQQYSNAIIMYLFCGVTMYTAGLWSKIDMINDLRTEEELQKIDIRGQLNRWKQAYKHPFNKYEYVQELESARLLSI